MAIYSLNLSSVGKTTHAAGTAGAHMRYIGRERAASEIIASHMPTDPNEARVWMDAHEAGSRKNARLCDKIRIALPRELSEAERGQLVQDYMHELTGGGRVPWYAAIHQTETDAHNPHAHVVLIDKDIETGKRVLALSDSVRDREKKNLPGPKAVDWVRERWEHHANAALEKAGHEARIDRRSLEDQGIDRDPQIHIGPKAQQIETFVQRPESKIVPDPSPKNPERVIDYPAIDAGRTRDERNAEIIDLNLARQARSKDFETRVLAMFQQEQMALDREANSQVIAANRERTLEQRRQNQIYAGELHQRRARRDADQKLAREWHRQRFQPERKTIKAQHDQERSDLKERHSRIIGRIWARLDISGRTRQRREDERQAQIQKHAQERAELAARIQEDRSTKLAAVQERYRRDKDAVLERKARDTEALQQQQEQGRRRDDALLQKRAYEREQRQLEVMEQIKKWRQQVREKEVLQKKQALETSRTPPQKTQEPPSKPAKDFSDARGVTAEARAKEAQEAARRKLAEQFRKARQRGRENGRDIDYE